MQVFFRSLPPSQVFWQLEYQDLGHLYLPMLCRSGCLYSQSPKKCFQRYVKTIFSYIYGLFSSIIKYTSSQSRQRTRKRLPWSSKRSFVPAVVCSSSMFCTKTIECNPIYDKCDLTASVLADPLHSRIYSFTFTSSSTSLEAQYMWYNTCVITLSLLPSAFSLSAHSAMAKWAGFGDLLSITLKKKEILTSLRNRHLTSRL